MTTSLNKLLLENIHTKESLDLLSSELSRLVASLYKADGAYQDLLNSVISSSTASFIEKNITATDRNAVSDQLNNLIKQLREIKTINLTFGFEPTQEAIENIHHWLLANMSNAYVLNINYDPKILGGIIIEYNGRFGDYSLRSKVSRYMVEHKEDIINKIRQV